MPVHNSSIHIKDTTMKKTLILLLMASASMSMAAASTDLTLTEGKLTWTSSDEIAADLSNYMFTFKTPEEGVTLTDMQRIYSAKNTTGNAVTVVFDADNNTLSISNGADTGGNWKALTYTANTEYAFAFQDGLDGDYPLRAYLMNVSTGEIVYTQLKSGTNAWPIAANAGGYIHSGTSLGSGVEFGEIYNMSAYGVDSVDAFKAAMVSELTPASGGNVPEPATATLSLLALAGLAARRRRK